MSSTEIAPADDFGLPFSDQMGNFSIERVNAKTIIQASADFIQNYGLKHRGQYFRCISGQTGNIVTDRTYVVSGDGTQLLPEVGIVHRHNSEEDADGGTYKQILAYNTDKYYLVEMMHPAAANFVTTISNASTVVTTDNGVELNTDTINQAFAQANLPGGTVSFDDEIILNLWMYVNSGQNLSVKVGVGMENAIAQQALNARIGLDVCDVANQPRNWSIVGGTGSTWSQDPTTEPVSRTAQRAYQLRHKPLQYIHFARVDDTGLETIGVKTTSVPGTGQTAVGKSFTCGIKTNENGGKKLLLSALRSIGPIPAKTFPSGVIT